MYSRKIICFIGDRNMKKGEIYMEYYSENYVQNMILEENLHELDRQERQIVLLYYWWGYNDKEIGQILNESQQMTNYKRKRALKKIKTILL